MDLYQDYLEAISSFPENSYFAKAGFVACNNDESVNGNILITGINPSVPVNGQYVPTSSYPKPFNGDGHPYFSSLGSFIPREKQDKCGYLDIFPFYEKEQKTLLANIRGNEALIANVLRITQTEIERIAPSLLIIANKSTYPFWGASEDCVWMGYDFQKVSEDNLPDSLKNRGLDIRIIKGFRQDELAQREIIYRPQEGVCRLKGTVAIMYSHSRNLASEQRLTESDFIALYDFSKIVKSISKYL